MAFPSQAEVIFLRGDFMSNQDEWFDQLYKGNAPRMIKLATYLLSNEQVAADLIDEAFLILLYKKKKLEHHPNLPGWLSQTLKNLILDESKSARHRLELPLNENIEVSTDDTYEPSLSELLPKDLTPNEQEILILYFEKQLSYNQIAEKLHISILNCRTRLFRAKAHYKELVDREKIYYSL